MLTLEGLHEKLAVPTWISGTILPFKFALFWTVTSCSNVIMVLFRSTVLLPSSWWNEWGSEVDTYITGCIESRPSQYETGGEKIPSQGCGRGLLLERSIRVGEALKKACEERCKSLVPEDGSSLVLRNIGILPHTTRCNNPVDLDLNLHRRENLTSRVLAFACRQRNMENLCQDVRPRDLRDTRLTVNQ